MIDLSNWAGSHRYRAANLHAPRTLDELHELVARCDKVKALGTRHSFNHIADTSGDLISLEHFNRIDEPDRDRKTVRVESGVKYGDLCRPLHSKGFALHNLASLPHISVAGARATATHGSGDRNGSLATAVSSMRIVTAAGEVKSVSRESDGELFAGMVVGLGALGVVVSLTLNIVPTFEMTQDVFESVPLAALQEHFDEVVSSAYSVSLFTDWRSATINQVWVKRLVTDGAYLAPTVMARATAPLHPIASISPVNCTEQMGVPRPWHERLPHFRMDFTPSAGEELQSEYLVPRPHAVAALGAVDRIRQHIAPLLQVSEIRTIAADDLWMSPCYRQACVGIHFTWKKDWPAVSKLLPIIEEHLAPFDARPHWGKLFTMPATRVRTLYEKLPDFQKLLHAWDPIGKFRNAFLDEYVWPKD